MSNECLSLPPLKPCPFCGGEAEMHRTIPVPSGFDYTPRCKEKSCPGRLTKKYMGELIAVYAWNRRAGESNAAD